MLDELEIEGLLGPSINRHGDRNGRFVPAPPTSPAQKQT